MKTKKIVRYRIPVSIEFPKTHALKGEKTWFQEKINLGIMKMKNQRFQVSAETPDGKNLWPKLHTCRANFPIWEKRFEKISKGEAVLELYYWTGKPYNSKTVTICQLGKDDGIGLQKLEYWSVAHKFAAYTKIDEHIYISEIEIETLAKNDGLSLDDFNEWFKSYDLSKPMAIIHFTPFRY